MTSIDVVLIADLIKVQLKHATGQKYLNMGHPIMFWDKYVGIERQTELHIKKSLLSMYTATGFGFIILICIHTAETSVCIDAYIPVLMMSWLLHIFPLWIFVIAA